MPAALEPYHRDLLYKAKKHHILTTGRGVSVEMDDGEEIKLEPMHRYDKPNVRRSCAQLSLFLRENDSDAAWNNLLPFLEGAVLADVKLPPNFYTRIVRNAYLVGQDQILMKCMEQPDKTGLSLRRAGVLSEVMLGLHLRAAQADFEGPEMVKIVRRAELLVRMLEDQFGEVSKLGEDEVDDRTSPLVLAVLLELTAEKALHAQAGVDLNDQVANYALKLLHLTEKVQLPGPADYKLEDQNPKLLNAIIVKNSIEWALKIESVRNSSLGEQLDKERESLAKALPDAVAKVRAQVEEQGKKKPRCLIYYDQLYDGQKGL